MTSVILCTNETGNDPAILSVGFRMRKKSLMAAMAQTSRRRHSMLATVFMLCCYLPFFIHHECCHDVIRWSSKQKRIVKTLFSSQANSVLET